jgi:hypothetical protein
MQNTIPVINVRALPEKAEIMIRRKFRGSLTLHKVIMGNNMKTPSTERSTDNGSGQDKDWYAMEEEQLTGTTNVTH